MSLDIHFSRYFGVNKSQAELDFFDIKVFKDTYAYVDPGLIRRIDNEFSESCQYKISTFFTQFLEMVSQGDESAGLEHLSGLFESNEYHLGQSKGRSKGNSTGPQLNKNIWDQFSSSKAAQSGLIEDIEDSILFIDQIGPDRISDIVCAILRSEFSDYTLQMCEIYNLNEHLQKVNLLCWGKMDGQQGNVNFLVRMRGQ